MDDGELAQEADTQRHTTMQIVERKEKVLQLYKLGDWKYLSFGE